MIRTIVFVLVVGFSFQQAFGQEIKWYEFEEAVAKTDEEPKKIFLDLYTDWCGWCKKMDASTFKNPRIAELLNEYFYPVKFNGEHKEPVVFGVDTFTYIPNESRGYHTLASTLTQGRLSYPTFVLIDEKFQVLQSLPGYHTAKDLEPILEFIGEESYNLVDWNEYLKTYESGL